MPVRGRLLAANRIEIGIRLSLQTGLGIPRRLAVARDINQRVHQVFRGQD
jgi:hypothetical protein